MGEMSHLISDVVSDLEQNRLVSDPNFDGITLYFDANPMILSFLCGGRWRSRRELNPYLRVRTPALYPLNYESKLENWCSRPESNQHVRFFRPAREPSLLPLQKDPASAGRWQTWCLGVDSNHRHGDFQPPALPSELPRQTHQGGATLQRRPALQIWCSRQDSNLGPPPSHGGALVPLSYASMMWCHGTELNRRHDALQAPALPTELPWHNMARLGGFEPTNLPVRSRVLCPVELQARTWRP